MLLTDLRSWCLIICAQHSRFPTELLRLNPVFVHTGSEQEFDTSTVFTLAWLVRAWSLTFLLKGPSRFSFRVSISINMVLVLFLTVFYLWRPTRGDVQHFCGPFPICAALLVRLKGMSEMQLRVSGLHCSMSAPPSSPLEWEGRTARSTKERKVCKEEGATLCVLCNPQYNGMELSLPANTAMKIV